MMKKIIILLILCFSIAKLKAGVFAKHTDPASQLIGHSRLEEKKYLSVKQQIRQQVSFPKPTLLHNSDWSKLFKMYYNMDISSEFLTCADKQLTAYFVKKTGIRMDYRIRLTWSQEKTPVVNLGKVAKMDVKLNVKYGSFDLKIVWTSKSGKIYPVNSTAIDPNDIQFWLEGLDVEKCRRRHNPDFSKFFPLYDTYADYARKTYHLNMSQAYVMCMREQLSRDFGLKTALKISKNISVLYNSGKSDYQKGVTSSTPVTIYVNNNWNSNVKICWKSKSGRIYDMADEDFNCDDVEMWFEGLEPELYRRQLFPKNPLPFTMTNITYKLQVNRIQMDAEMTLRVKKNRKHDVEEIENDINHFIGDYNEKSESLGRSLGVIHNAYSQIDKNIITFDIDIGSVGPDFFKKLFRYLSELNAFEEVVVD